MDKSDVVKILKDGGIGVLHTDTIYGLVGSALNENTVERIYRVRKRSPEKPFIILISSLDDLQLFEINIDEKTKNFLQKIWPNKVSVVLTCNSEKFHYLHRGTNSLAFRLPDQSDLSDLIRSTGPLVAPSANLEGETPAETIDEAKKYFGDLVDFYLDAGKLEGVPSTLIKIENGAIQILREGAVKIDSV